MVNVEAAQMVVPEAYGSKVSNGSSKSCYQTYRMQTIPTLSKTTTLTAQSKRFAVVSDQFAALCKQTADRLGTGCLAPKGQVWIHPKDEPLGERSLFPNSPVERR